MKRSKNKNVNQAFIWRSLLYSNLIINFLILLDQKSTYQKFGLKKTVLIIVLIGVIG